MDSSGKKKAQIMTKKLAKEKKKDGSQWDFDFTVVSQYCLLR